MAHLRDRSCAVRIALAGGLLALPLAACGVIPLDPQATPAMPPKGSSASTEFAPETGPFVRFSAVGTTIGGDLSADGWTLGVGAAWTF